MRRNKYNARKTLVDGIYFDSIAESHRYIDLKFLQKAGEIKSLETQVPFLFTLNGKKIFKYYADFTYTTKEGIYKIEDVKGMKTAIYRLKKKLIEAQSNIVITEISGRGRS